MAGFSINQTSMDGNLTRDPELRSLPSGTSVCSIRIAHNERERRNGEWVDVAHYFDWTIWSGLGEWVAKNLSKGDRVVLAGRARWHEWETREGGKRQAVDFTADSIITPPRGQRSGGGSSAEGFAPRGEDGFNRDTSPEARVDFDSRQPDPVPADDDIPF